MLRIDEVSTGDLVRELSSDSLTYFSGLELSDDWPSYEDCKIGKFVRLGEVILIGAAIKYGPLDFRGQRESLVHIEMTGHGLVDMGEDVKERIYATAPQDGQYLREHWPLVDAGWARIKTDGSGLVNSDE